VTLTRNENVAAALYSVSEYATDALNTAPEMIITLIMLYDYLLYVSE